MSEDPGGNGPCGREGRSRQEMLTGAARALQALIMPSSGASLETLRHGARCHVAEVTGFASPLLPPHPIPGPLLFAEFVFRRDKVRGARVDPAGGFVFSFPALTPSSSRAAA